MRNAGDPRGATVSTRWKFTPPPGSYSGYVTTYRRAPMDVATACFVIFLFVGAIGFGYFISRMIKRRDRKDPFSAHPDYLHGRWWCSKCDTQGRQSSFDGPADLLEHEMVAHNVPLR